MARDLRLERGKELPLPDAIDSLTNSARISAYAPSIANPAAAVSGDDFWGEDGFSFGDVLDLINPLQHLPLVGSLYRSMTGDEISTGAQIFGGGLFGGPLGAFASAFNVMFEEVTGGEMTDHVLALFDGDGDGDGDGAPAVFAMAMGSPETHDRAIIGPAAPGSIGQQAIQTASLESRRLGGPDRGAGDLHAWQVAAAVPAESPVASVPTETPVATLASETVDKAPPAAVWLSSMPQASNGSGVTDGAAVSLLAAQFSQPSPVYPLANATDLPVAAQLLLQSIGYPLDSATSSRIAAERYEQRQPMPSGTGAAVDSVL